MLSNRSIVKYATAAMPLDLLSGRCLTEGSGGMQPLGQTIFVRPVSRQKCETDHRRLGQKVH